MPQTQVLSMRRLVSEAAPRQTQRARRNALTPRATKVALGLLALTGLLALLGGWRWVVASRESGREIGQVVPDFALFDVRTRYLHRICDHDGRVVVIAFTGARSPSDGVNLPRLTALATANEMRRIDFIAINSNASESLDEVADNARRLRVTFPVLKDPQNRVADLLGARNLYEVLVIDEGRRLRYRGRIDDQLDLDLKGEKASRSYLADALDAVVARRPVPPLATVGTGQAIERVRRNAGR
jgi:peroxiredoxin